MTPSATAAGALRAVSGDGRPFGVMFHHFHGDAHPPVQGSLSAAGLREVLLAHGAQRIAPARAWQEQAITGRLLPGAACLTFDDSLKSQHDVAAPVLRELGLTAFFFVYTSVWEGALARFELHRQFRNRCFASVEEFNRCFLAAAVTGAGGRECAAALSSFEPSSYLEPFAFYSDDDRRVRFLRDEVLGPDRSAELLDEMMAARGVPPASLAENLWLSAAELKALHDQGHVVGLHSHTHPLRMARLSEPEQEAEYAINSERLAAVTGERPRTMSHPSNSYDARTLAVLGRLGVTLGFRSDMRGGGGPLEQPRQDHVTLARRLGLPA